MSDVTVEHVKDANDEHPVTEITKIPLSEPVTLSTAAKMKKPTSEEKKEKLYTKLGLQDHKKLKKEKI